MRNKTYLLAALCIVSSLCLASCGKAAKENPYGDIVAALDDNTAYAFLDMDYDNYVMVSSDMIYNAGSEGSAASAAASCDIYYCVDNKPQKIGEIMSEGTAYPISFSRDGIYAASGHMVEKYAVSEKEGKLYIEKGIYEEFDEDGNALYRCVSDGSEAESNEEEFLELHDEYSASQIVHFSYGASGCVNEISTWK